MSNLVKFDDTIVGELSYILYEVPTDQFGNPSSESIIFSLKTHNTSDVILNRLQNVANPSSLIDITVIKILPSFSKLAHGVFLQSFKFFQDSNSMDAIFMGQLDVCHQKSNGNE